MIYKAYLFEGDFDTKKGKEDSDNIIKEAIFKYLADINLETNIYPGVNGDSEENTNLEIAMSPGVKGNPEENTNPEIIPELHPKMDLNSFEDIEILRDENGKPYVSRKDILKIGREIHFNLSHSGKMAVLMVGEAPCGIDLQVMEVKNHKAIAKKYYSENERAFVEKYGIEGFFRIWVHREAFGKLTGEGVLSDMPDFVDSDGMLKIEVTSPLDNRLVYVKDVPVSNDILLAYATYGEDDEIVFEI